MAGLRHNPAARYCSKRTEDDYDPDAVCDYCSAKGFDKGGPLPAGLTTVANNTGEPEPVEQGKPLIVQFFERIGIVKGSVIEQVRTVDNHYLAGPFTIVDMAAYKDEEVVISLREPGLRAVHRVVWSKIASYVV